MTTKSSKLVVPSASHSSLTAVDISLVPLPSSSCVTKDQDFGNSISKIDEINSIFHTGNRSATIVKGSNAKSKTQDVKSHVAVVDYSSQFVSNQLNHTPSDECIKPKHPPIPVNLTILTLTGSMIFWYSLYFRNNHSKDDDLMNLAEKVMIQLFEVASRFSRYCFPIYWIKRKEETKSFALLKIKSFLLRYLTPDKAEHIMSVIVDKK